MSADVETPFANAEHRTSRNIVIDVVCVLGAFFNGFVIVVNLGASGVLTTRVHGAAYVSCFNSVVAAVFEISLLGVLAVLPFQTAASTAMPKPSCAELRQTPCWMWWLGGLLSAYTLTAGIFVAAEVGVALSTMTILSGNLFTSTLFETLGFGGQPRRRLSPLKVGALILVVGGAVCMATADSGQNQATLGLVWTMLSLILLLAVGMCVPFIAVVNGRLCDFLGHTLRAAFCSDSVTACSLLIVSLVYLNVAHPPDLSALWSAPAWAFVGGPCSVCFTCILIVVPRRIGVAAYACSCIAGQQVFGVLFDGMGLFAVKRAIAPARVVGSAVTVAGAVLFQFAPAKAVKTDIFDAPRQSQDAMDETQEEENSSRQKRSL